MKTCRICSHSQLRTIFSSDRCPQASHKFLDPGDATELVRIDVFECEACKTVQLPEPYPDDYADDYQRNASFSPTAQAFMRDLVGWIRATGLVPDKRRALEIGCGDGSFSRMLAEHFDVRAVEPSRAASALARAKGVDVRNEYFDARTFEGQQFDLVVSRFVLEHIFEPHAFLDDLCRVLKPGGVLSLEVPNYELQRREGRFFDFYREHVFYYDAESLTGLCKMHDLHPIALRPFMNDEYLHGLYVLAPSSGDFAASAERVGAALQAMLEQSASVACWGAAGGGVSLLSYAGVDPAKVRCLVDSDPNKHGMSVHGLGVAIEPPGALDNIPDLDAVLILSPTYELEIARTLRDKHAFRGKIGSIKGVPHWLDV